MRKINSKMTLQPKQKAKPQSQLTMNTRMILILHQQRMIICFQVKLELIHLHHLVVRVMMDMGSREVLCKLVPKHQTRTMETSQLQSQGRKSRLLAVLQEGIV